MKINLNLEKNKFTILERICSKSVFIALFVALSFTAFMRVQNTTVKITQNKLNTPINLAEVQIYDSNNTNISKQASFTASSIHRFIFSTAKSTDGSGVTFAGTKNSKNEHFLFSLPKEIDIKKLKLQNSPKNYEMGLSDDLELTVSKGSTTVYNKNINAYEKKATPWFYGKKYIKLHDLFLFRTSLIKYS